MSKIRNRLSMYGPPDDESEEGSTPKVESNLAQKDDPTHSITAGEDRAAHGSNQAPTLERDGLTWQTVDGCPGLLHLQCELPFSTAYGHRQLGAYRPFRISRVLEYLPAAENPGVDLLAEEVLFLDLETTGLSKGSGVYAFLVGLGYFQADRFVCEQFFLDSPEAEPYMLERISARLSQFRFLFTFNGKSFDLPLLGSRHILNFRERLKIPLLHFDLYQILKRIYKNEVDNHRLTTYEKFLLGLERTDDIPGAEIPQRYFDYIHYQTQSGLKSIAIHNQLDIFSLSFFLLECIEQTAISEALTVNVRSNLARILGRNRRPQAALRLLEPVPAQVYASKGAWAELLFQVLLCRRLGRTMQTMRLLFFLDKNLRAKPVLDELPSTLDQLKEIHGTGEPNQAEAQQLAFSYWRKVQVFLLSRIEAAKEFEHTFKRFDAALGTVDEAGQLFAHYAQHNQDWQSLFHLFSPSKHAQIIRFMEREQKNLARRRARLSLRLEQKNGTTKD